MVSHLLSLCRTFLPFHGWRCKRPGRRGARFPLQRSILGVPGCEGKYKTAPNPLLQITAVSTWPEVRWDDVSVPCEEDEG